MKKIIQSLRSKKGATLVEIAIVSIISVFMILTILALLSSSRSTWLLSDVKSDLYINARKAMNEMFDELVECSSGNSGTFTFVDPINGQYTQGLWFASPRGNPDVAGEDGSSNNNYVHIDGNGIASWRSLVVYCPYNPTTDLKQLRRYVDYGPGVAFYSGANIFPLSFLSVNATTVNFLANDGSTVISINRTGGRVLANHISTEDANNNNALDASENDGIASDPIDNQDGVLNYGINFTKNVGNIDIVLFLAKQSARLKQEKAEISTTLRNRIKFRQP